MVVADEGHALLRRRKLRLADLAHQEWLLPEAHIPLRRQVDAAFRECGLPEPTPRIEIDFGSTSLFDLMQGTQMLSIANEGSDAMEHGLHALPLGVEELDLRRHVGVMTRAGLPLAAGAAPDGTAARTSPHGTPALTASGMAMPSPSQSIGSGARLITGRRAPPGAPARHGYEESLVRVRDTAAMMPRPRTIRHAMPI